MGQSRQKDVEPPPVEAGKRKRVGLMVGPEIGDTIQKDAALHAMSVEQYFELPEVRDFFTHRYLESLRKEGARLSGPPRR